jgi:fumarate reductase subunit C
VIFWDGCFAVFFCFILMKILHTFKRNDMSGTGCYNFVGHLQNGVSATDAQY